METILIFRIGSLGDTIVALPCFHRIARSFPHARRIVVTDSPTSQKVAPVESVLGDSGLIDGVIYFPPPPRRLGDFLLLRSRMRQTRAQTLIYVADRTLLPTLRDVFFFRACGVRRIVGAPLTRELRRLRIDPVTGDTEHEAERLARCLAPIGSIDLDDPTLWDLHLEPDELRAGEAAVAPLRGRDFVAVGLGGKIEMKNWGDDNWSALLQMMAARAFGLGLVFIGSGDEFDRAAGLAANWRGPTLNLCGNLTPRESAAAIARARYFLGHDSGPMHLAAAVGTPCVALFGPANVPKTWHPMGPRHRVLHNRRDIRAIKPDAVLAAVEAMTAETSRRIGDRGVSVTG